MPARKNISNKTRFEIFKRDSFTCQYCGKKAPEVILNVDHIKPVKLGGENDLLNLITSCFECNSGKKAVPLDDSSVIHKQQKQLEELNERRLQLEMLIEWRNGLTSIEDTQINHYVDYVEKHMPGYSVSQNFRLEIKKWVKKYRDDLIVESIDESATRYLVFKNGKPTEDSAENFTSKIRGILYFKSLPPIDQKINWIKVIIKKAYRCDAWDIESLLREYVSALEKKDWSEGQILDDLQNEVRGLINRSNNYSSFATSMEKWISDINNWQ